MKTTIATILATATLSTTAFAGRGEMIEDPKIVEALKRHEYAGYLDPKVDSFDPGPNCTDIAASKSFSMPLYSQEIFKIPFTAGVGGTIGMFANATDGMGADLALGPTVELLGQQRMPLDVTFTAVTKPDGTSSLDVSANAFGFTVATYNLADSTTPISFIDSFGWSLPNVLSGSIGDTYPCPGAAEEYCSFSWNLSSAVVASVGAILIFRISPATGVEARALIATSAYASLGGSATLTGDIPGWGEIEYGGSFHGHFDVTRLTFGGRAILRPYNGYWLADGAASLSLDDTMGADVSVRFDIPDNIPLLPDVIDEQLFGLQATQWGDDWKYSCTFDMRR